MKTPANFDPARAQALLAYLRQGGFPFVAADAAGVPPELFHAWMRRGEQPGAREPLRSFARSVRQAIAQARLLAELSVCKKDPKFWLGHGPGRQTPDSAGWTGPARATDRPAEPTDPQESARSLCALVLDTLTPFPEARARVSEQLLARPEARASSGAADAPAQAFRTLPPRWSGLTPSMN
jgi:hypothetical protein